MKNIFKLTEGDLTKIVKRVIKESIKDDRFISKVLDIIELPYFQNLRIMGISEEYWNDIFNKLYGEPVNLSGISDSFNYISETLGKIIYYENSNGEWEKREYDSNGYKIYHENSNGYKYGFDDRGNSIYYEDPNEYWEKREYDENNNLIFRQTSDGIIEDYRNNN